MIAAVVLAAGLSRRMGRDKLMLPLGDHPVFAYAIDLAARLPAAQRIVVTNTGEIADYARQKGCSVVPSPYAAQGMGHSVAAGAAAVCPDVRAVLFINADQPFLTEALVHTLCMTCVQTDQITVPRIQGRPCSPCVFPARFLPELMALAGDRGGKQVYQAHPEETCFVDWTEPDCFADLDDPETYRRYAARFK